MSTKGISEGNISQRRFPAAEFQSPPQLSGPSLGEDPEYPIDKDPRTPAVHKNPVNAMELVFSDGAPSEADLSIQSHGKYHALNSTEPLARWNREAFQLLYPLLR